MELALVPCHARKIDQRDLDEMVFGCARKAFPMLERGGSPKGAAAAQRADGLLFRVCQRFARAMTSELGVEVLWHFPDLFIPTEATDAEDDAAAEAAEKPLGLALTHEELLDLLDDPDITEETVLSMQRALARGDATMESLAAAATRRGISEDTFFRRIQDVEAWHARWEALYLFMVYYMDYSIESYIRLLYIYIYIYTHTHIHIVMIISIILFYHYYYISNIVYYILYYIRLD